MFPATRLRRLRRTEALRSLVRENAVTLDDLIQPIFVEEGISEPVAVTGMPGVNREPETALERRVRDLYATGIRAVILFGVSHAKDADGSDTLCRNGLLARMIRRAKDACPEMTVLPDLCFCEYTTHGHCGVLVDGDVDNDRTLANLAAQAVIAAEAGADLVAPSGMMDGQVAAIRQALDDAGYSSLPIMAYSTKFASGFYGPFRAAAGTTLRGDRKTYQMDPGNGREAIRESLDDAAEGADILLVKPGMPYLDVLARLRDSVLLPLAVYQVSGEYAMIRFAARAGAIDETTVMMESLLAFKRAGADLIITYFAESAAAQIRG